MSTIAASSATTRRPTTVTAAAALLVLLALGALLPLAGTEEIPRAVLVIGYVFAALKLVAAVGLWRCRKWAAILGFVVVLLDALAAAPGLLDPPSAALGAFIGVGMLLSVAALVLLALPASRRAYV